MSSDIVSLLGLDKGRPQGQIILVKEINGCDSSFITSCIIGQQIKSKSSVLLITWHNMFTHYHNIGLKLNYNLSRSIEGGTVDLFNAGELLVNNVLDSKELPLNTIFLKIKERVVTLLQKHNSVCIMFEGFSHLFDLAYSLRDVNSFVRDIIYFVRELSNSFVVFQCNMASNEDVTSVMSNMMSHMADTILEVANLTTGLSADVSGHLNLKHPVQKFDPQHVSLMEVKSSCYHFKLFDRGVKLFAPGVL